MEILLHLVERTSPEEKARIASCISVWGSCLSSVSLAVSLPLSPSFFTNIIILYNSHCVQCMQCFAFWWYMMHEAVCKETSENTTKALYTVYNVYR